MDKYDVVIIGAGAAGLMCASIAGARGRRVFVVDHGRAVGKKIRISGGGRCNFTNLYCGPENFISTNPHFCKSALARFTPYDFLDIMQSHGLTWHEKNPDRASGQLFCDQRAPAIIDMLLARTKSAGVKVSLQTEITNIATVQGGYKCQTTKGTLTSSNLVVACGGPSIPKIGGSSFGYNLARQFELRVINPVPALVPLRFTAGFKTTLGNLSGLSVFATASANGQVFQDDLLFTHRGMSGPAILQISSYWNPGETIEIDLLPHIDLKTRLKGARQTAPRTLLPVVLQGFLPTRLARFFTKDFAEKPMANVSDIEISQLVARIKHWRVRPAGSEGFRKAEVTRGGVDTHELSSQTMEARKAKGLYFIGEVVDVTGHLGGHNFQWAWASAAACGNAI